MSAVAEILRSPEELLFSWFLKHAPVGLALCQSLGRILAANPAFQELMGPASNQVGGQLSPLIQAQGVDLAHHYGTQWGQAAGGKIIGNRQDNALSQAEGLRGARMLKSVSKPGKTGCEP